MDKKQMKAALRIEELRNELNTASHNYYILDQPTISDQEYDKKYKELVKLEELYPELVVPHSPTQRIGASVSSKFEKLVHKYPLMSLDNVFDMDELTLFNHRLYSSTTTEIEYVVEPKLDGAAVEIVYQDGVLVTAATRGDGKVGEDITANIRTIKSLPLSIPQQSKGITYRVRGEVIIDKKSFEEINTQREQDGKNTFANPRNAAAGTLRQLDPKEVAKRKLKFFAYDLLVDGQDIPSQFDKASTLLYILRVPTVPQYRCHGIDEVRAKVEEINRIRKTLAYDIDGAVIKVNSCNLQSTLGFTSRAPKWAIAYKFAAEQATTIIKDIIIQVGRTGALTPVAIMEPIEVGGVTVERATLHNQDQIDAKGIFIGAEVVIQRAGDVIPEVVEVTNKGKETYKIPDECPVCGSIAVRIKGEAAKRCTSASCPAKLLEGLKHFVCRDAMNIDGIAEKLLEQLIENKLVEKPADLFSLLPIHLSKLDRMGVKSANKAVEAIQKARITTPQRLLYSLGIHLIGRSVSKQLIEHYGDIETVMKAKASDLVKLEGVGAEIAQSLTGYFNVPENVERMEELLNIVSFNTPSKDVPTSNKLEGKTFVVTGTHLTDREILKAEIVSNGGKVVGSISKKVNILLAGVGAGPKKLAAAEELGILLWNEEQFRSAIS
jgi:DNA ligase (NAD+)